MCVCVCVCERVRVFIYVSFMRLVNVDPSYCFDALEKKHILKIVKIIKILHSMAYQHSLGCLIDWGGRLII